MKERKRRQQKDTELRASRVVLGLSAAPAPGGRSQTVKLRLSLALALALALPTMRRPGVSREAPRRSRLVERSSKSTAVPGRDGLAPRQHSAAPVAAAAVLW